MSGFKADFLIKIFIDFNKVVLKLQDDGNNVSNSHLIFCGWPVVEVIHIASPNGYEPNPLVINKAQKIYKNKLSIENY